MGVLTFSKLEPGKEFRPDVTPVKVTWTYMKEIKEKGNLIPGQYYRITDYVTTVAATIDDESGEQLVRSAGHPFDVIVRADSVSTLSETAWAIQHDGDTYFENSKLEAWQLKYCLDNDTTRFAWADTENGKGVIYEMEDEWGNRLPYDFKNVQFRRYLITGALGIMDGYMEDITDNDYAFMLTAMKRMFNGRNDQYRLSHLGQYMHTYYGYRSEQYLYDDGYEDSWDGTYTMSDGGTRLFVSLTDEYDTNAIIAEVDKSKACWCHTFGVRTALTVTETTDHSLSGKCAENRMTAETDGGAQLLGGSIFVWSSVSGYARKNDITGYFRKNTFSGYVWYSQFSGYVDSCSFSGYVDSCSFSGYVDSCSFSGNVGYSQFSGNVEHSQFSGSAHACSFSGNVYACSFSGTVYACSFSGYIEYSQFSGDVYRSQFSGSVSRCSFSGYVGYSQFSGYVRYSQFSGYVEYSQFSGSAYACSFSGDVRYSQFSGYVDSCSFSGNVYTSVISGHIEECTITTNGGASGTIKNLYTLGSISGETISIASNSDQPTYAAVNSDGDLQTWNPADLV